jgi:hypothetical protein
MRQCHGPVHLHSIVEHHWHRLTGQYQGLPGQRAQPRIRYIHRQPDCRAALGRGGHLVGQRLARRAVQEAPAQGGSGLHKRYVHPCRCRPGGRPA